MGTGWGCSRKMRCDAMRCVEILHYVQNDMVLAGAAVRCSGIVMSIRVVMATTAPFALKSAMRAWWAWWAAHEPPGRHCIRVRQGCGVFLCIRAVETARLYAKRAWARYSSSTRPSAFRHIRHLIHLVAVVGAQNVTPHPFDKVKSETNNRHRILVPLGSPSVALAGVQGAAPPDAAREGQPI